MSSRSDSIGRTCPFCQAILKAADDTVVCSECQTAHHADCWRESGGCTTPGCRGEPFAADAHRTHSRPRRSPNRVHASAGVARIVVNGREYAGHSVSVTNNQVVIDGVVQGQDLRGTVQLEIIGCLESLETTCAVTVHGNVGSVHAGGSVTCGNVDGDVDAGGSVTCGKVSGDVDAGGSVIHG
jgi:hypothetical protein